jgi:5-(carboxyamino)imidazole ribonucleotide mutase
MKKVFIAMGSDSDWPVMKEAAILLEEFGIEYEAKVVSAHRSPEELPKFTKKCEENEAICIIAGAGGAAHLPGMLASYTYLPVIGVPIRGASLDGIDSLLSIVQMPNGVPVATMGINKAKNAALFALRQLSIIDSSIKDKLLEFRTAQYKQSLEKTKNLNL